ncbi:MAG: ABC transporter permease [Dehalococcoidales bacterium]|nr:ABC transporter permease [Dehalococcoidales bacterium]
MTGLKAALWVELLKARRSKAPWLTLLGFSLLPLAGGLFMIILKDPEWARNSGLISTKAQLAAGTADWPAFFDMLAQGTAIGGFILFGLIAIWTFGREYSDRTAKDMLALPVSREAIVMAKFVLDACWSLAAVVLIFGLALAVGFAVGLPGWSEGLAVSAAGALATIAGLAIVVISPFAWVASAGRGYLPPIGVMFLILALSQILAILGWGDYFPWAVPALASGVAGPSEQAVGIASYLIVALTGILGVAGTLAWWRWADQTT